MRIGRLGRRLVRGGCVAAGALLMGATAIALPAQQVGPKRTVGADASASCPQPRSPVQPNPQRRATARQFFAQGQEAAIGGDNRGARDHFRRAAEADPTDATTAYHLARAHEALGEVNDAIREYCRYLALDPRASDAAEARERLSELGPRRSQSEVATAQFRSGLLHYDAARWREAQDAFTRAINAAPDWPESHFNRGLVFERLDLSEQAAADFERYLHLEPAAPDRDVVLDRIVGLRRQTMNPASAFVRGLALPGLGQHYTRRPVLGVVVLGAAGGAIAYALQPKYEERTEIRTYSYTDPFGNVYEGEYDYTFFQRERPNLGAGIAAAAAISLIGAFEAWNYARSATSPNRALPAAPRTTARAQPLVQHDWTGETRVGIIWRF